MSPTDSSFPPEPATGVSAAAGTLAGGRQRSGPPRLFGAMAVALGVGLLLALLPSSRPTLLHYPEPPSSKATQVSSRALSPRLAAETLARDLTALGLTPALYADGERYFVDLTVHIEEIQRLQQLGALSAVRLAPGPLRVVFQPPATG